MTRASRTALRPRLTRGPSPRPAPCVPWHPPTSRTRAPHEELGRGVAPGAHRRVQRGGAVVARGGVGRRAVLEQALRHCVVAELARHAERPRSAKGAFGFDAHGFDVGAARERRHRAGDVAARRRGRQRRVGIICSLDTRATAEPPPVLPLRLTNAVFSARGEFGTGFAFGTERASPRFRRRCSRAFPPSPSLASHSALAFVFPQTSKTRTSARVPGAHVQNARAHLGDVRAHLSVRAAALDAERHAEVQARPFGSAARNPRTPRSRAAHARAPRRRAGLRRFFLIPSPPRAPLNESESRRLRRPLRPPSRAETSGARRSGARRSTETPNASFFLRNPARPARSWCRGRRRSPRSPFAGGFSRTRTPPRRTLGASDRGSTRANAAATRSGRRSLDGGGVAEQARHRGGDGLHPARAVRLAFRLQAVRLAGRHHAEAEAHGGRVLEVGLDGRREQRHRVLGAAQRAARAGSPDSRRLSDPTSRVAVVPQVPERVQHEEPALPVRAHRGRTLQQVPLRQERRARKRDALGAAGPTPTPSRRLVVGSIRARVGSIRRARHPTHPRRRRASPHACGRNARRSLRRAWRFGWRGWGPMRGWFAARLSARPPGVYENAPRASSDARRCARPSRPPAAARRPRTPPPRRRTA